MQMVEFAAEAFAEDNLNLRLRPYRITCTGGNAGLVEVVRGTRSIDQLKKRFKEATGKAPTLLEVYVAAFGPPYSPSFGLAQREFARSLAAYSAISYVFAVKDRHNANLLIDRRGRLVHIDFGFMLGGHPGAVMWETAPFKMSADYVELLGGTQSPAFAEFAELLTEAIFSLKRRASGIIALLSIGMGRAQGSAVRDVAARLSVVRTRSDVMRLLTTSMESRRDRQYDYYQLLTNGILP